MVNKSIKKYLHHSLINCLAVINKLFCYDIDLLKSSLRLLALTMTKEAMEHSPGEPVHCLACQILTDECSCYAE